MSRTRVLLAEDHAIVAEGLQSLLEDDFELVATVGDGRALVDAASRLKPDVIVADISMPLLNGLDACRQIKKDGLRSKIVFLTMHADVPLAKEAFRSGASAYLLKRSASKELITAIREVENGRRYVTPLITDDPITFLIEAESSAQEQAISLTPRQREVLQLIAEGRTMKEIAAILNISSRTVASHKYKMMESHGVRTTPELVQYAIKLGLVSVSPPGRSQ
ncbi:MAG TPA: response regulator transcription factor [Blastocatellia bacterium]|nr:response regulator transcription factor [Blastocatellia bacterium]